MKTFLTRTQTLNHKRTFVTTALVVALAWVGVCWPLGEGSRAFGQFQPAVGPQANPAEFYQNVSKHGVAVVDISYIFKNHLRFKQEMDQMKSQMEQIETQLKTDREAISKMESERNQFKPDTEDYRNRDIQLAKAMADFNIKMNQLRKEFLDREAKVYYRTYKEIVDAVSKFASAQGIALVIRFNGDDPIDTSQREAILKEINKPVVFQNRIDITPLVLDELNRGQPQPRIGSGPGAPGAAQPPVGPGSMLPRTK